MSPDPNPYLVRFPKGTVIFSEGDGGEEMFFIHSGKVRIEKNVEETVELLALLEKGDFFGEMSLLDRVPRTATARVEEDAELLRVDAANFQRILEGNIEIAVRIIRKYTARLREANEKLGMLLKDRTEVDREIQEILKSAKAPLHPEAHAEPPRELALLAAETGGSYVFPISKAEVSIGRQDPVTNLYPDVDLTSIDRDRSVSRRHARLELRGETFLLFEEVGVANGTFINGKRVEPGTPAELRDGDRIGFGKTLLLFQTKRSGE